jgi:hypothetical protein
MLLKLRSKRNEAPCALWPALDNAGLTECLHVVAQSRLGHRGVKIRLEMLFPVGENTDDAEANGIAQGREGTL